MNTICCQVCFIFVFFILTCLTHCRAACIEGDCRDGKGVYTWESGARYEGDFAAGRRTGRAVYTFASGDRYDGEFLNGRFHGTGTYCYSNGDVYTGQWRNGTMSGHGILTRADGTKQEGEFQDGALVQKWKMDVEELHERRSLKPAADTPGELPDDAPLSGQTLKR